MASPRCLAFFAAKSHPIANTASNRYYQVYFTRTEQASSNQKTTNRGLHARSDVQYFFKTVGKDKEKFPQLKIFAKSVR